MIDFVVCQKKATGYSIMFYCSEGCGYLVADGIRTKKEATKQRNQFRKRLRSKCSVSGELLRSMLTQAGIPIVNGLR